MFANFSNLVMLNSNTTENKPVARRGVAVFKRTIKKFNPARVNKLTLAAFVIAFASIGGIIMLIVSNAAQNLVVDTSIPRPRNVQAFGDDRVITVTWDSNNDSSTVGYYITYKKKGAASAEGVKQTEDNMVQIQPVVNGQEYEITVQAARGSYQRVNNTDIGQGYYNNFARANGRVSEAVTTSATPSDARVAAQRQRLTGFFDDFNTPSNPMDELKWNNAASGCAGTSTVSQFINAQFHAHNTVRSGWCDRGGQVARPRADFNTSAATESNPAQIEFDIDGVTQGRDTWYLDIIPKDSRKDGTNIDITGHNDMFHSDTEDPGNMIRVNPSRDGLNIVYYNANRVASNLPIITNNTACDEWWMGPTKIDWGACDMTQKTPGLSPLPQPTKTARAIANVRRHWVVQMTPTKIKVYIDSVLVAEATLPTAFASKKVYTLHSTLFSYNTGKGHNDSSSTRAYPYVQMFHWDNFGFSGPSPTTVVHNYIDGGPDGKTPTYFLNQGPTNRSPRGVRTTVIPVPDDIGNLKDDKGTLYFTIQNLGYQQYSWTSSDHILFNGVRYNFSNPKDNMINPRAGELTHSILPYSAAIKINKADIRKGNNTVTLNIRGAGDNVSTDFINVHLELEYDKNNAPSYTQPIQIFGQAFSRIAEPPLTNCDSYTFVEQDLNLPYLAGKANLAIGPCQLTNAMPSHNPDYFGPVNNEPTLDTTAPTVQLTAPSNNTQVTNNTVTATATATDNVGVSAVEFYLGGVLQGTDSSSPYEASLNLTSREPGTYAVYAVARDAAGNIAQSSSVNVIKPQPQDTTRPNVSITAPANNTTLQQNATTLDVTASATDNVGVTRVDFYLDGSLYAQDSTSGYGTSVSVGSLTVGSHTIYAIAYDAAGNSRQSDTVNFTKPAPPANNCPAGQTGTPPNCTVPEPETCPEGQTGTPPNCKVPDPDPEPNPNPDKPGDLNGDGRVGFADLAVLLSNYGRRVNANTNGDLNGDGRVNFADLARLLSNYGK